MLVEKVIDRATTFFCHASKQNRNIKKKYTGKQTNIIFFFLKLQKKKKLISDIKFKKITWCITKITTIHKLREEAKHVNWDQIKIIKNETDDVKNHTMISDEDK